MHCFEGKNRSATFVLAYLMQKELERVGVVKRWHVDVKTVGEQLRASLGVDEVT